MAVEVGGVAPDVTLRDAGTIEVRDQEEHPTALATRPL